MPAIKLNGELEGAMAVVPEVKGGQRLVKNGRAEVFAVDSNGNLLQGVTRIEAITSRPLWEQTDYLKPKP